MEATIPSGTEWAGVKSLVQDFAKVDALDLTIVLYAAAGKMSAAWTSVAIDEMGIGTQCLPLPLKRVDLFKKKLSEIIPAASDVAGKLVIFVFEKDRLTYSEEIRSHLHHFPPEKYLLVRIICSSPDFFSQSLNGVTPEGLTRRNTAILDALMEARHIEVKTPAGTELQINLNPEKYKWISNRGVPQSSREIILPAGEVATYPERLEGILVADYAINTNTITDMDVRLSDSPVRVEFLNGEVVSCTSSDQKISRFLMECMKYPNARLPGELGFGTNYGVKMPLSMNSHVNERKPGVHIGLGQHNQSKNIVSYECPIHLDLIASGGEVTIPGTDQLINLNAIHPSTKKHPDQISGIDVFDGDCCSIQV